MRLKSALDRKVMDPATQEQTATPPAGQAPPATPPAVPPPAAGTQPPPAAPPAAPTPPAGEKKEAPAAPKAPEKYDLKAPQGVELSPGTLEKIAAFSKERGFSNEVAQAVVELAAQQEAAQMAALSERHGKLVEDWKRQAQVDPEIGGARFHETVELAKRALKRFAPPELLESLEKTGYGNYVPLLKTFARVGQAEREDKFVTAQSQAGPQGRSLEEVFYGTQK